MSASPRSTQSKRARRRPKGATPKVVEPLANRDELARTHPIMTGGFKIPTPPIQRAFGIMCQTVLAGLPGCAFVAFPRFGKSYAAQYCERKLLEVFPALAVVRIHAHHEHRLTPTRFFSDLLHQTGFGDAPTANGKELRSKLVRAWWVLSQSRNAQTLAIIGDEMQCVSPDGYSYLIDITNDLNDLGLRTITLSFGQPDLNALRTVLRETHRGDILGRFLSRVFAFEGIGSEGELREVMRFYDDPAEFEYPERSGLCFSQFFLPRAFAGGWRLSSCAATCWEKFRQHAVTRLSSPATVQKLSVGMQWIAGALQFLLVHCSDLDAPDLKIGSEDWDLAVESSGFAESLGLTYDPDWETSE